jgi:hypothetical protein
MSDKIFSVTIKYNAPVGWRSFGAIREIYNMIDAVLNHPPKDYFETSIVDDNKDYWSIRMELDEQRSEILIKNFVDRFADTIDAGMLEIINKEIQQTPKQLEA